jgi:Tol biopolymer transport system component
LTASAVTFLVMELVEGEDLSERISRGPIPIDEAVSIARQIAEALEAAHEAGIVHRDLKPANIKLRPDGTVKVLDFGLAKAWETNTADSSLSLSPTMTQHATAVGLILGTAAYMSPEQAAGTAADRRADIWSFGVVSWEMLTGHKLFDGETVSHVLASVLKDEVELEELPEATPPRLRELIGRCLERKPRQRLQAIGDARIVLEDYERDPEAFAASQSDATPDESQPSRSRSLLPWAVAGLALLLLLASALDGWLGRGPEAGEPPVLRALIPPPDGTSFALEAFGPGAGVVSPDGMKIVFAATDGDGLRTLWVRRVSDLAARPLPGTEGAIFPFWSPDSRSAAFFSGDGKLRKIDTTGGPPVTICLAPNGKGGSWNDDGQILFAPAHNTAIHVVSAAGGESRPATEMPDGVSSQRFPYWLPGGRFMYFARSSESTDGDRVMLASIDTLGPGEELFAAASNVAVASGQLLFIREGTLMARPFDPETATFLGDGVPVAEDVMYIAGARYGAFSVSDTGLLIYNTGLVDMQSELVWADRSGDVIASLGTGDLLFDLVISPDGRYAAASVLDETAGTGDIWIYDLNRGLKTRYTFDPNMDWYPTWSPDGRQVAFSSNRDEPNDIWVIDVSGSGTDQKLFEDGDNQVFPEAWSPDGEWLVYQRVDDGNNTDIWAFPTAGGESVALVASSFTEDFPSISPDGRWLAFVSDESGTDEVYVTTFPDPARRWQVSTDGGSFPRWRGDGGELFFAKFNGELYSAEVDGQGETFDVGEIQRLFSWNLAPGFRWPYDVSSDGQKFLLNRGMAAAESDPMTVVLNWDTELERAAR